ncbi:MAG TPA: DUF3105 domain-containing protein [Solirubrobacterales bacterium]|nr:DUF3105 domain-containing protein [Solirubrobacterales bacterium]
MGQAGGKGGLLFLAVVVAIAILAGCGGDSGANGSAHVNEDSGSTHDLPLDEREGTPPLPVKQTDLRKAAERARCSLYTLRKDEGSRVVPPNYSEAKYESYVPTSGPHVEPPYQQADGAYMIMPEPIDLVASLDHGRIEIHYAPTLREHIQLELKGLYDSMYGGTLLFPNEFMTYSVAVATWRGILACNTWYGQHTIDAIRAFGKATWGKRGSEPVVAFPVSGPTPRDPEEPSVD